MNFSAFGGPFSGIHQFAKSFGHEQSGAFTTAPGGPQTTDIHGNRYHSNTNHFNQNTAVTNSTMQYGQNISIPYSQPQEHNFLNTTEHNKKNQMKMERDREDVINQQILQNVNQSWQTLANPGNTVDYSSHLLSASLPISIQHFLKYSETIKKENGIGSSQNGLGTIGTSLNSGNLGMETGFNIKSDVLNLKNGLGTNLNLVGSQNLIGSVQSANSVQMENNIVETTTTTGKKKKKKPPKEKKPRPKPGEIRETKALDGSTLYCCPECQMAYPDRSLIEQHVVSHAVERRFVCDICHAALKRKDHLTRHKLSHIPDRPHVCTICMKSFKRKEQLTLHIVIHSGEKKHVCPECGKGFYRKDHLRKHTRSHIARRVKSEVSAQTANNSQGQGSSNMHTS